MFHSNRWLPIPALLVALALACASQLRATEFDDTKLAEIRKAMQGYVDRNIISGAVTVVGSSKGIVHHEAVGSRDLEANKPMTKDTIFRVASMTKPITAIAIMILQDEGKLSVEDPVEKHLPEFKGQMVIASKDKDTITLKKPSRPITIRDLLTHTSGLPGGFPPGMADLYSKRDFNLTEATIAQSQRPLEFEPGTKWAYCNAGIDTLGRIVEVLSGQSFEAFIAERVCKPLGMKDTWFYPSDEQLQRIAVMYGVKDGKLVNAGFPLLGPPRNSRHPIPAGGLYSTGDDMARFYLAMLRGGELVGKRIVSAESVKAATSTQTGDIKTGFVDGMSFGFGFAVVKEPKGVTEMLSPGTFGHGGAFATQSWADPKKDAFFILMIQRTGLPNADASDLRRDLQRLGVAAIK